MAGCVPAGGDGDAGGPCRHASDCSFGSSCVAGTCVANVRCTSSRSCAGLVCNVDWALCVECSSDVDCGAAAHCRAGVCEADVACTSDRECSGMREVCDRAAAVCVECGTDADCVFPRICGADHACSFSNVDAGLPTDAGSDDAGTHDVGLDASTIDAASLPDGGADAGMGVDVGVVVLPGDWELVGGGGGVHYPGYSDSSPGILSFYALSGGSASTFAELDTTTGTWSALTPLVLGTEADFASPAWVGSNLVLINGTSVYVRDSVLGPPAWRTLLTGVAQTTRSQTTHEGGTRSYALADDGRIVIFDGSTVSYQTFGMSPPATIARLAWSEASHRLYVAPNLATPDLYEVTPFTGPIRPLAPIPEPRFTPTFCGDLPGYGYLYAAGGNTGTTIWRYDIAADAWRPLPALPFDHDANGSCTVSSDGWLYVTDDGTRLARIRVH